MVLFLSIKSKSFSHRGQLPTLCLLGHFVEKFEIYSLALLSGSCVTIKLIFFFFFLEIKLNKRVFCTEAHSPEDPKIIKGKWGIGGDLWILMHGHGAHHSSTTCDLRGPPSGDRRGHDTAKPDQGFLCLLFPAVSLSGVLSLLQLAVPAMLCTHLLMTQN